jgi:phage FluMu protein gp41
MRADDIKKGRIMSEKTVTLVKPLTGHNKQHAEVTLREPTAGDYLALGEPRSVVKAPDGSLIFADNDAVIANYVRRCIVAPIPDLVIGQACLADMMKIREAVLDFFAEAKTTAAAGASS